MKRLVPALLFAALAAGASGGAFAQTVADYEAAVDSAQVADKPVPAAVAQCRPLFNYVETAIPANDRARWAVPFYTHEGSLSEETQRKLAVCAEAAELPVISFNTGSSEEIVTPPKIDRDPKDIAY